MADQLSYEERHASAAESFQIFAPGADPARVAEMSIGRS